MTAVHSTTRSTWGGARAGAGRPAKHAIASEPHKIRPALSSRHPVHVTARVVPAVRDLRTRHAYAAIRRALVISLGRADFRIVHLAIVANRIELVAEADDRLALARGMQGFQIAAARALNRRAGRTGTVFPDRYRPRILRTRPAVRAVLAGLSTERAAWPQTWLLVVELAPSATIRRRSSA